MNSEQKFAYHSKSIKCIRLSFCNKIEMINVEYILVMLVFDILGKITEDENMKRFNLICFFLNSIHDRIVSNLDAAFLGGNKITKILRNKLKFLAMGEATPRVCWSRLAGDFL